MKESADGCQFLFAFRVVPSAKYAAGLLMTVGMTTRSIRKRSASRADKPKHRKQGAPTIADVAAYVGFAPMTVSRVINGESNVRQETREAVQAAIAKLKYSPNLAARTLAGAEQVRVGMLYSNPSAAFLSEFLV